MKTLVQKYIVDYTKSLAGIWWVFYLGGLLANPPGSRAGPWRCETGPGPALPGGPGPCRSLVTVVLDDSETIYD
jgi:hypothetical protein